MEYIAGSICMICAILVSALGVFFVQSCVSGWMGLAKRFRFRGPLPKMAFRWQMGAMGPTRNGCLSISADRDGLLLAMPRWLSLAHAPLFIPWCELTVHAEEVSLTDGFLNSRMFAKFTEVSVSGPSATRLRLPTQCLPPGIPDACREARSCFEAEFPDEEIRRVALEQVDDDRYVIAVSYGYGQNASREYYSVLRTTMQASRIAEYP